MCMGQGLMDKIGLGLDYTCTLQEVLGDNYQLPHDAMQHELDQLLSKRHDESFDLARILDQ